jgi:hypothetical protein
MQSSNPNLSSRIEKIKKGVNNKAPLDEVFNPDIMVED